MAFCDALAEYESAGHMRAEPVVRVIAHELVARILVDWMHRGAARARMGALVKRLVRFEFDRA